MRGRRGSGHVEEVCNGCRLSIVPTAIKGPGLL